MTIAKSRAAHYADEFDDDEERSLNEDTLPFFEDDGEVTEWAINQMNWSDLESDAIQLESQKPQCDRDDEWMSCNKDIRTFS